MTITTLDGVLAGMQPPRAFAKALTGTMVAGRPHSLWATAGNPGPGSFDNTLNGVNLSSSSAMVNGQLPHVDPGSGNAHLARLVGVSSAQAGVLMLADRLWHNGGYNITSTSAQNTTFPGLPSRDANGFSLGDGVLLGVEISAATGAGTPTITANYTNQAGTSGKTATNSTPTVASSIAGSFYPIGLAAGDTGVRSVQSLTLSATWTSGTMNLVAYRPIAQIPIPAAGLPIDLDALTGGFPKLHNGSVPYLIFIPSTTTTTQLAGTYVESQG